MNPFASLSFATPSLLVLLPAAIGALIYAYRRAGRGERHLVGTVLLLKSLRRVATARRIFRPPPRFFLELLLLAVLVIGAAGLYRDDAAVRLLIVIDDSMSMGATSAEVGARRLDRALRSARATLDALPSEARVSTVRTSAPTITAPDSPAIALTELESIVPTFTADNLERLLPRLGADPRFDRVVVFTDRSPTYAADASRDRIEITTVIDRPSPNIAVTDIAYRLAPSGQPTVRTTVTSYADTPVALTVRLVAVNAAGTSTTIDRETISLPPLGNQNLEFERLQPRAVAFGVTLESATVGGAPGNNALPLDDSAWVSAGPTGNAITVVSDLELAALGLTRLRHLRFNRVRPADWTPKSTVGGTPTVFHRFAPPELPAGSALFVLPPTGGLFTTAPAAVAAEVTRWDVADPLASYLNVPTLTFKSLVPLLPPPWGRPAITTTAGVAAFTGTVESHRYIVTGFEIFPYEGSANRVLSILTLNAFSWLADTSVGFSGVGSTFTPTDTTERVRALGQETLWSVDAPTADPVVFTRPGVVSIEHAGEPPVIRAINAFDERESNLLAPAPLIVPAIAPTDRAAPPDRALFTSVFALLALALLLLDLFLFAGREPVSAVRAEAKRV